MFKERTEKAKEKLIDPVSSDDDSDIARKAPPPPHTHFFTLHSCNHKCSESYFLFLCSYFWILNSLPPRSFLSLPFSLSPAHSPLHLSLAPAQPPAPPPAAVPQVAKEEAQPGSASAGEGGGGGGEAGEAQQEEEVKTGRCCKVFKLPRWLRACVRLRFPSSIDPFTSKSPHLLCSQHQQIIRGIHSTTSCYTPSPRPTF